jgi:glycerophosphoryl diester phosphodiesterase
MIQLAARLIRCKILSRLKEVSCMKYKSLWLTLLFVGACATSPALIEKKPATLSASFDCLREKNVALVSAHRGQSDQTKLENALASLKESHAAGIPLLEIDIATTQDGVLVLMHDDTLNRTTNGTGSVSTRDFSYVDALMLKRPDGRLTRQPVPTLSTVLIWGKKVGAHFQLDVKRSTRFEDVVRQVRATGMENKVVVITYNLTDAALVAKLAPELMISTNISDSEGLEQAQRLLPGNIILGWTGTRTPNPQLMAALRAAKIEPLFGTLGAPGKRLDDIYLADGNPSEYADLARAGAVMIASDAPLIAQRALGHGYKVCWN